MTQPVIPQAFVWRRLHSLMGVWLVLFLFMHLLTNSQAALLFGEDGLGFIHHVELIHSVPYLKVVELTLLGIPFIIHMAWGVKYLFTGKSNTFQGDGSQPYMKYGRNKAYTWQRITAWVLLLAVVAHVIQMRFLYYPEEVKIGKEMLFLNKVSMDNGLYTVADRLGAKLLGKDQIKAASHPTTTVESLLEKDKGEGFSQERQNQFLSAQQKESESVYWTKLKELDVESGEVAVVSPNFGTATLFMVRDTFKSPLMVALYSLFVLAATYHAFNGLWTSLITWGVTLTPRSQEITLKLASGFMVLVALLGLVAAWGTYWINLRY